MRGRNSHVMGKVIGIACVAAGIVFAAPAHADVDTNFNNELHIYGIYNGKDYNAWIGKLACKRLNNGLDSDANEAATFVHRNLAKDTTSEHAYQFLGAALRSYCPDKLPILQQPAQ
jgi:hypothetical protein